MNKAASLSLATLLLAPLATLHAVDNEVLWIEAEHYAAQHGSRGANFAMLSASGGTCVDDGWGGREGDFLRFKLELAAEFPSSHVTLK